MEIGVPNNKQLILFDGVCNLCNSSINYVIKHDHQDHFLFAPIQGETGKKVIEKFKIDTNQTDSIILYSPINGVKFKSSAALAIGKKLGFPRNFITVFYVIPTFIRDLVYDYIAKNRYKWYGKKDACLIPAPELKAKFMA